MSPAPDDIQNEARTPTLILGGTFDPIHLGHLSVVERAQKALGIHRSAFLLAANPPHKVAASLTPAEHRLAMLELALVERPDWTVCRLELERDELRYTLDTLRALRDEGVDPVFAIGGDSLRSLHHWHAWETLIAEFDIVVHERPDVDVAGDATLPSAISERIRPVEHAPEDLGRGGRILRLFAPPVAVSSSEIRRRVRDDANLEDLVPVGVARYIREHGLYREDDALSDTLPPPIRRAVEAAGDRLARDVVVLDLRGRSDVTDYFVVCHGTSDRQVQAIADHVVTTLRNELRTKPVSVEGRRGAGWVLLDYIDFVIHVFDEDSREFYRLERLWGDAPQVDVSELLPAEPLPDFDGPRPAPPGA